MRRLRVQMMMGLAVGAAGAIGACTGGSGGGGMPAGRNENRNTAVGPGNSNVNENTNVNVNSAGNVNGNANDNSPGAPDLTGELGEPISPLSAAEQAAFLAGRAVFEHRFTGTEGLGPQLNAASCRACHGEGASGGGGERYRNTYVVAHANGDGTVSRIYATFFLPAYGPSEVFPSYGGDDHAPTPSTADVVAQRNPPALFGVGLFELVADAALLALQDPNDADGDGIRGVANVIDGRVGRYGYKAQGVSIEEFTRGMLQEQCGITSDPLVAAAAPRRPRSLARRIVDGLLAMVSLASAAHAQVIDPNQPTSADGDNVPEPEMRASDLAALVAFQRTLAAPRRGEITDAVRRGEDVFEQTGCGACHVADLDTPRGVIHPYTDLLLHEMGDALADGLVQGRATGGQFRTAPLWGLRFSAPYLHDGRADSLAEGVEAHGGEAQMSREQFGGLDAAQRDDLLAFLGSL